MILRHPEWLALFPILLLAGWSLPRLNLWRPLPLILLALTTLTLAAGLSAQAQLLAALGAAWWARRSFKARETATARRAAATPT